jgi:sulfotransferase family protein
MSKLRRYIKRNGLAARKAVWRIGHSYAPNTKAVYILGAQRSGTTLLLDCFDRSMEIDVLGESSRAMVNFKIVGDDVLDELITSSRHKAIVFKPLTDSHRAREFLRLSPNSVAIWAYRRVEDRANSAVAKFGDHNLQILRDFASGKNLDIWQAQGLTDESLKLINSFNLSDMSPHDAAAVFWYIRNSLYFSNKLDELDNVLPLAYEDLVAEPQKTMQGICRFIECQYSKKMISDVHTTSVGRERSNLSENTRSLCVPMYNELHETQMRHWRTLKLSD